MAALDHALTACAATPKSAAPERRKRRTRFKFDLGDQVVFRRQQCEVIGRGRFVVDDEPAFILKRLDGGPVRPWRFVRQPELVKLSGDAA